MGTQLKAFSDGSFIEYDKGKFDDWCVYLTRPNYPRFAPRDNWYFAELKKLANHHSPQKIYFDFLKFYNPTSAIEDHKIWADITTISSSYENDANFIDILFSIIYAGMIAEEKKANTRLGKRIKHLGVYQTLILNVNADVAANFSRGMAWREIDSICRNYGF